MFTLAHLSDVHLPPLPRPRILDLLSTKRIFGLINWQRRRRVHRRYILNKLVADLKRQQIDHIAVTGDLTNIGLPEEFNRVRDWLAGLGEPERVTVVPGNHDAYTPLLRDPGYRRWEPYVSANEEGERFMGGECVGFPALRLFDDVALIGLSTARPTLPGTAYGRLGRAQVRALASMLVSLKAQGLCRVVLIHHPPIPGMAPWPRGLHDATALYETLCEHGAELVIYGHDHRARVTTIVGPSDSKIPVVGVSSASLSSRDPEKMARYHLYTIARTNEGGWNITMRSRVLDMAARHFTEVASAL
ncbi:MAG: metallophosphoesterase [Alphaproteobacteria bacterium]